jgi:hypothetical protein
MGSCIRYGFPFLSEHYKCSQNDPQIYIIIVTGTINILCISRYKPRLVSFFKIIGSGGTTQGASHTMSRLHFPQIVQPCLQICINPTVNIPGTFSLGNLSSSNGLSDSS